MDIIELVIIEEYSHDTRILLHDCIMIKLIGTTLLLDNVTKLVTSCQQLCTVTLPKTCTSCNRSVNILQQADVRIRLHGL